MGDTAKASEAVAAAKDDDSPANIVRDWAQQFAQSHQQVDNEALQHTCGSSGLVTVSWCNAGQGTGNCLNRILTAALVAVVFNKPLAITEMKRPAFDLGLAESQGKAMPWLIPPQCLELQSAGDFPTCSRGVLNTCGGSSEIWHDLVCVDFSRFDVIHVETFAFWDFGHLSLNRRTPSPFNERLMKLTAPGVNAYGLVLHALWPHGLTRVRDSLSKAVFGIIHAGLHIRCDYTQCTKDTLGTLAQCVAHHLENHSGSSCNIFLRADDKDAREMARELIRKMNPNCSVLVATDMLAHLASDLQEEISGSKVLEKGSHGNRETWKMPVDLEVLTSSELVVGERRSTFSALAGASSGRLYFGDCDPWHHNFPLDDRGNNNAGFGVAKRMTASVSCDEVPQEL